MYLHKRRVVSLPALDSKTRIIKPVMKPALPGGTSMKEEPRSAPKARIIKPVMRKASFGGTSMKDEPRNASKARITKPVMRPSQPGSIKPAVSSKSIQKPKQIPQSAGSFQKASKSFQSCSSPGSGAPLTKDSSTRSITTKRSAESCSQSRKKSFATSTSVPRMVPAKEKASSILAKGNRENSIFSPPKANLARPMTQVVEKSTAVEKPAE